MILRQYGGWLFDWGLTVLSTQIRSYRAFKAIEYFDEKLHLNACVQYVVSYTRFGSLWWNEGGRVSRQNYSATLP